MQVWGTDAARQKISHQLDQINGFLNNPVSYPYDLHVVQEALQAVIDGRFEHVLARRAFEIDITAASNVRQAIRDSKMLFFAHDLLQSYSAPHRYLGRIWEGSPKRTMAYFDVGEGSYGLDEVYARMKEARVQPATFEELLAFALAYPGEQLKYQILGLGTPFTRDQTQVFPCLTFDAKNKRHEAVPALNFFPVHLGFTNWHAYLVRLPD